MFPILADHALAEARRRGATLGRSTIRATPSMPPDTAVATSTAIRTSGAIGRRVRRRAGWWLVEIGFHVAIGRRERHGLVGARR